MKGGLCFIYTSLLTVSVLSSCVLFLLVVSEALQPNRDVDDKIDLSGLSNISQKTVGLNEDHASSDVPSEQVFKPDSDENSREKLENQEMTFTETLSLNVVTTDELPDVGHPPVLISLTDNTLEIKKSEELLFVKDSEHNDTVAFTIVDSSDGTDINKIDDEVSIEPRLIVKAKPMHEVRQSDEVFHSNTLMPVTDSAEVQTDELNELINIPLKSETPQEDIPSFSEWAQKQLAEAEKKDIVLNHSSQPSHSNTNFSSKSTKLRSKNYASPACGAKIVGVNPEAGSASSILSSNRDEYMLNTCNSRIWFVVELCEAVQAQKIELANFELFSSTPKDIAVYFSDRFPTREWASVGQFSAEDIRDIQSFDLYPHLFGKFIKVEMLSHHGSEHYCPISLFKVYGTSEFEVLEKENSHTAHIDDEDEDDEIIDVPDIPTVEAEPSKNLFGSARDAVMSIMKKAAQALVKTHVPKNMSNEYNDTSISRMYKRCCSPSHIIVCDNCSEALYNEVYELISCSSNTLTSWCKQVFLHDTLKHTSICQPFGFDFKSTKTIEFSTERVEYVNAFIPTKYLAALCNILAIKEKKVVLNTSFETELNTTNNNITYNDAQLDLNKSTLTDQDTKPEIINNAADSTINNMVQIEEAKTFPEINIDLIPMPDKVAAEQREIDSKKDDGSVVANADQDLIDQTAQSIIDKQVEDEKTDAETVDSVTKQEPSKKSKDTIGEKNSKELTGSIIDEINDPIIIENENFLSEFDQIAVDPTPAGATIPQNQVQNSIQKESVFLRLSNRVKALERNMSLSGQYLEELSRRYKKQVEEMQKTFDKTVQQMTDDRRKSNEREQKYLEQMSNMQEQLTQMGVAMKILIDDRDHWFGNVTFFKFIVFQTIIIVIAYYYITKRRKPEPIIVPISRRSKKKHDKSRRKSVEGVSGHKTPMAKKRRPSEEALQITRLSAEDPHNGDDGGEWQVARKNRRRKTSILHRSLEPESKVNWARQNSLVKLQENPPLDEEEFYAPVTEPTQFTETSEIKKLLSKTNGSIFNNLKSKTMKTRRLSSPAFLRTFNRQSTRSTSSSVVKNLEPILNGNFRTKGVSDSPTSSLWSNSTEISQLNGQHDNGKKKKSLKNIFKKVF